MENEYFTISNIILQNGENAKHYNLVESESVFFVNYISGELMGREKIVEVSSEDYIQLKNDIVSLKDILIKYRVG